MTPRWERLWDVKDAPTCDCIVLLTDGLHSEGLGCLQVPVTPVNRMTERSFHRNLHPKVVQEHCIAWLDIIPLAG